jgi:hypothetical protein
MRLFIKNSVLIRVGAIVMILSLAALAQSGTDSSAQRSDALQIGTVQSVLEHPEGRIFDWASWVPIYDGYPYYDMTIKTPDRTYVVRYESMTGYYPTAWQAGKEIKLRRDHGQLLLLRYDGELVPTRILR